MCDFALNEGNRPQCRRCGFVDLVGRHPPHKIHRPCDSTPWFDDYMRIGGRMEFKRQIPKCGCMSRRERMNAIVPGSGDMAADVIDMVTLGKGESLASAVAGMFTPFERPMINIINDQGFGDAVRLTYIVRHIHRYFPEWDVDVTVPPGCETIFNGIAHRAYSRRHENKTDYHISRQIAWPEPEDYLSVYPDSPSTIAEWVIRNLFQVEPIEELCRYEIHPTEEMHDRARRYKEIIGNEFAVLHYRGSSVQQMKNPSEHIFAECARRLLDRGITPVVFDFTGQSGLLEIEGVKNPGAGHPVWDGHHGGNGGQMAAIISQACLFIGIDSGPSHCAGATETPAIVNWMKHHPLHYYSLCPNVTHLVPNGHEGLLHGHSNDERAAGLEYFRRKYDHLTYHHLSESLPLLMEEKLEQLCLV